MTPVSLTWARCCGPERCWHPPGGRFHPSPSSSMAQTASLSVPVPAAAAADRKYSCTRPIYFFSRGLISFFSRAIHMPKSTSGLFVACAENVFLVLFFYALLGGLMDLVMPIDFSPAMRGVLNAQLALALLTGGLILGQAAVDRTRLLVSVPASGDDTLSSSSVTSEPVEQWIVQRLVKCRWGYFLFQPFLFLPDMLLQDHAGVLQRVLHVLAGRPPALPGRVPAGGLWAGPE